MASAANDDRTTAHTEETAVPEYKRLKGAADTHTQDRHRGCTPPRGTAASEEPSPTISRVYAQVAKSATRPKDGSTRIWTSLEHCLQLYTTTSRIHFHKKPTPFNVSSASEYVLPLYITYAYIHDNINARIHHIATQFAACELRGSRRI